MTRVMLLTFFGEKRWQPDADGHEPHPHESPQVDDDPDDRAGLRLGLRRRLLQHRRLASCTGWSPVTGHAEGDSPVSAVHGHRRPPWWSLVVGVAIAWLHVRPQARPGRRARAARCSPGRPAATCSRTTSTTSVLGPRRRAPDPRRWSTSTTPLRRRRRQRHWPPRSAALSGRLRKLQNGYVRSYARLDARRRGGPGRRDPADEGGLMMMSFPLLTATAALPVGRRDRHRPPSRPQRRTAGQVARRCVVSLVTLGAGRRRRGPRSSPAATRYQLTESHAWIPDFGRRATTSGVDGIARGRWSR